MNCDILKIVRGNDFATQMTITALDAGGNVIEDFSLEESTEVVVKYTLAGESHTIEAYDYDIEGNDITIQWSDLSLGKYGFEIEGKFNGYSWRSAAKFIFQIVADNASANIPDGVLVDGVYKLSDWLRLLSGGSGKQVQADWDETDTSSPAYIQNKPNLAPVATSGSYNDLTNKPTIPDVSGKADKVSGAVSGDFAALDANGNLTDSGKKASDFATAEQGAKADTAIQDISGKQDVLVSGTNIKTINNESILGSGNITIEGGGGDVESVNGKTGVVVLNATDVGAATAAQGAKADTAIQEIKTINGNSLVGSGNIVITEEAVVFDGVPTQGSVNGVTSGGVFDYTKSVVPFVATSNNLADAVAEVPTEERCVGKIVEFTDANGNHQKYKYMGKYYTDEDWNSMASATTFGAWLDLNNADKYRVYYFRLTPTLEGTTKGSIDTNGNIGTGTDDISDYIEIPENGVTITGGMLKRYVLYDENKTKLSSSVLYGEKTFSTTNGKYVRVAGPINWKIGIKKGTSSVTYPRNPHVEVVENYEDLIDYNNADGWAGNFSPFIRLKKGETIRICNRYGNPITHYIAYQKYDLEYNALGQITTQDKFAMEIDGYVKIGSTGEATRARTIAAGYRLSKSLSMTIAKKRLLVVGDSTSILTYSSELETNVAQGYPYFIAIDGEHEISVTNQAVSGNTCSQQFTILQERDLSVYDAITIFVGTNNYGYSVPSATFKTELETMVEYIIAQKPSIKIGLLTLLHRASAWNSETGDEVENAAHEVLSQYTQAIREVGQKYSLPVLDIWNECQCNFNYETYVANYSSTASNPDGDGLHPTNEAHKLFIYPLYREFIKKLFVE